MIISIDNKWKSGGKNNLREGYESYNKDRHVLEKSQIWKNGPEWNEFSDYNVAWSS